MEEKIDRIIRIKELTKIVGLSRSTIYNYAKEGKFPTPKKLNPNSGRSGAVGWKLSEIEKWIEDKEKT